MPVNLEQHLWTWLEDNPNIEIGTEWDDTVLLRVVYKRIGNRNDSEWIVIAKNESLRDALFEAMRKETK